MEDSGFPKLNLSDSQRVEELARIFCKEKRKKIKKPRFFPKKNKSAYIFFTQECKEQLMKTKPNTHLNSLMKEIAIKWSAMTMEERVPFAKLAQKDKKRYFFEKNRFLEGNKPFFGKSIRKHKKKAKITPYLLFAKEARNSLKTENSLRNPAETMREIANRWKLLSEERRKPFIELCKKLRFEKEIEENQEICTFFEKIRKKQKNNRKNCEFRKSAFLVFCQEKRLNSKKIPISELAEIWSGFSLIEKQRYSELYLQEKADFIRNSEKIQKKINEEENFEEKNSNFEEKNMNFKEKTDKIHQFFSDYETFLAAKQRISFEKP